MDDALAASKNVFSVIIIQINWKVTMKTNCRSNFSEFSKDVAGPSISQWAIVKRKTVEKTLMTYARRWFRRHQLRNALSNIKMDVELVEKDIGLAKGSLYQEAYKPFWQE